LVRSRTLGLSRVAEWSGPTSAAIRYYAAFLPLLQLLQVRSHSSENIIVSWNVFDLQTVPGDISNGFFPFIKEVQIIHFSKSVLIGDEK
jgi:hypothetical protein